MKAIIVTAILFGALIPVGPGAMGADSAPDIKKDGAFAFPQAQATVVCDQKDLRLSIWNDAKYLYVQAILWEDGDDSVYKQTKEGQRGHGWSQLCLDVDRRQYGLRTLPSYQGLLYAVGTGATGISVPKKDSKGRGAIRYLDVGNGQRVRVDSYVIPLAEIGKKAGDKIRLAYFAQCPTPERTINSIGYEGKRYWGKVDLPVIQLPLNMYHEITLADRAASLDIAQVPDGWTDKRLPVDIRTLRLGTTPPEVSAKDWINADAAPTLAALKGKVVVVAFWSPAQGGSTQAVQALNKLHDDYHGKGLTILSLTTERRAIVDNFLRRTKVKFAIGADTKLATDYGAMGRSRAFLIGKDGNLLWEGSPTDKDLEQRIQAALK